eukprot:TRINITY_DN36930_c0_g3_i1.p2 TRINITY_DN36930_c0_g3~~TRINITY_DN36930_c0_g3_i1.p2  ORF type:complete len:114 (+),score=28.85 TRINITY_DN36930_c0_g3_i1:211-552(+)
MRRRLLFWSCGRMPEGILGLTQAPPVKAARAAGKGGERRDSSAAGSTKRKATQAGAQADMADSTELVKYTAMLSLSNAQTSRAVVGITMDTLLVKKDKEICKAIKTSTEAYAS